MTTFHTIGEMQRLAREKLPDFAWHYANGGAASESTLRRNQAALDRLALEQRILVDVRSIDITVDFLGMTLPSPVIVAPMGSLFRFHPEGDPEMARGAGRDGSLSTVSGVCGWPMEEIARAASGPLMFQLYHMGDRDWVARRLDRVLSCPQYKAICLTVDVARYSRRDRDLVAAYGAREDRAALSEPPVPEPDYPQRLTWDDVDWLRRRIPIPFGLKGILHRDDAVRSLDAGCDFVWVSNHGGRQLDSGRASIDVLPDIAEAVGGRAPLIVDGGFTRGTDVIKGMALGATVVAMGKAAAWALAAGGAGGVTSFLEIERLELIANLSLAGKTSVRSLSPGMLTKVDY